MGELCSYSDLFFRQIAASTRNKKKLAVNAIQQKEFWIPSWTGVTPRLLFVIPVKTGIQSPPGHEQKKGSFVLIFI